MKTFGIEELKEIINSNLYSVRNIGNLYKYDCELYAYICQDTLYLSFVLERRLFSFFKLDNKNPYIELCIHNGLYKSVIIDDVVLELVEKDENNILKLLEKKFPNTIKCPF